MDENLNSNMKPSEAVSAFGDQDASYVNAAAQRLRRSGDVVVIESPNHALRDHYIKQILSLSFLNHPGLTVHRCKKERDSMVTRINRALGQKTSEPRELSDSHPAEIWLLDLQGTDDFELLKLAQTLVTQFCEAGICMLVSCSTVIADNPRFKRWSNRLSVPVWRFELPDSQAMKAFLVQESRMGAVNQARLLVNELESLKPSSPHSSEKSVGLERDINESVNDIMNSISQFNAESSIPKTLSKETMPLINPKDLKEYQDQLISDALDDSSESVKPDRKAPEMQPRGLFLHSSILPIGLGFMLTVLLAFALMNDSEFRWVKALVGELTVFVDQYTANFFEEEKLIIEDVSEAKVKEKSNQNLAPENEDIKHFENEKDYIEVESIVSFDSPTSAIEILKLESKPKVLSLTVDQSSSEGYLSLFDGSDAIEEIKLPDLQTVKSVKKSANLIQKEVGIDSFSSTLRASDYYAQLGAFSTEKSAQVWRRIRASAFPETTIVEKRNGLWVVLSGPYSSRETAKQTFSQSEIKPYMMRGSDLRTEMNQVGGRL